MPCDSSHMEANGREVELSRVLCLLEEAKSGKHVDANSGEWSGYHPKVYSKSVPTVMADSWVEALCAYLKGSQKLWEHSLEMQMWWRDHQRADAAKAAKKKADKEAAAAREAALEKLTPEERKALGLDE